MKTLTQKIVEPRIEEGVWEAGATIGVDVHQVLTHDALGGLVFLQFASLGIPRVRVDLAVAYADHNVFGVDPRMKRDHLFIQAAARKFGAHFSKPGTGICHQVHLERFAAPGKILLGSDSHTPTAGGLGMIAVGAGGLDVALSLAGSPLRLTVPKVVEVRLSGRLQEWVTAKDVILELLRRLTVKGGVGKVYEFIGPGIASLNVPERATITNMCTELGATTGIFPSDEMTLDFLRRVGREDEWTEMSPDPDAVYDEQIEIDLDAVEPLVATPSMPDNVVPVRELDGLPVGQVLIGSCTNGSYVDLRQVAEILRERSVDPNVEMVINPSSKQSLELLARDGLVAALLASGANLSEATCGPCIGLTHQPAPGMVSLRTFNRNFSGRSGLKEDAVYLCSPFVAAVAAVTGCLRDPRDWASETGSTRAPLVALPDHYELSSAQILPPASADEEGEIELPITPDMQAVPDLEPLPEDLELSIVGIFGDDITTDDISPANPEALASMTSVPEMAEFTFQRIDEHFVDRIKDVEKGLIVAGKNYGQGSSRENAALAPRHLGIRVVIAESFARIHRQNLINWGILPLRIASGSEIPPFGIGERVVLAGLKQWLIRTGGVAKGELSSKISAERSEHGTILLNHDFSKREILTLLSGGVLATKRKVSG